MKNLSVRKFCLICKFLCVPFLIKAQGNVFHYADSIYDTGNYSLAAVEYERVIFENPEPAVQARAALKKAGCLKMLKEYAAAAATLDAVNTYKLSDAARYRVMFRSVLNSYLAHDPNTSFSKLEMLCHFYPDSTRKQDILLLKILSLNELKRWKKADTLYREFMLAFHEGSTPLPDPYLKIPRLKNPEKAEKLSAYLPFTGAGLFYAGDIKEGLLNVVLQVGFIGFGAYSIIMERYITGVLIGVGGYAAFYHGGVRRAKSLVETYNKKKTLEFNTRVRNQLLQVIKNREH